MDSTKTQVFLQGLSVPAPLVTPIVLTAKSHEHIYGNRVGRHYTYM